MISKQTGSRAVIITALVRGLTPQKSHVLVVVIDNRRIPDDSDRAYNGFVPCSYGYDC